MYLLEQTFQILITKDARKGVPIKEVFTRIILLEQDCHTVPQLNGTLLSNNMGFNGTWASGLQNNNGTILSCGHNKLLEQFLPVGMYKWNICDFA